MQLNQTKLDLLKKIIEAKLSTAELKEINGKAEEILQRRQTTKKK